MAWVWPLLRVGASRPLKTEDIWPAPSDYRARAVGLRAEELWQKEGAAAKEQRREPRLLRPVLLELARGSLARYLGFSMCCAVGFSLAPRFLRLFLSDLELGDRGAALLLLRGAAFAACYALVAFCVAVAKWNAQCAGVACRLAVQRLVYGACLAMPLDAPPGISSPMNLMSVDAERFFLVVNVSMPHVFVMMGVFPILLISELGVVPAAVCMASTIGSTLLQKAIAGRIATIRRLSMNASDRRLQLTEQFLDGIRVLKMSGWTEYVQQRLAEARAQELQIVRRVLIWKGVNMTAGLASPALTGFCMFASYAAIGGEMTADVIFPALTILRALQIFMGNMPLAFSSFAEFFTAYKRVCKFLTENLPQESQASSGRSPEPGETVVRLKEASWVRGGAGGASPVQAATSAAAGGEDGVEQRTFSLGPVSLDLNLGSLCVICGPVGSGKTTLLLGMLKELIPDQGQTFLSGSAALCGQEPWIRSATVRENVRCLRAQNPAWYAQAVRAAQLGPDLMALPAADETEIGSQGINLSGGQKARIALARAMFGAKTADVVFLDDVLSAVDGHVAQRIIREVILGVFRDRTRVLVANTFLPLLLPHADSIVVLAPGGVVETVGPPRSALAASPWLQHVVETMGGCDFDHPPNGLDRQVSPAESDAAARQHETKMPPNSASLAPEEATTTPDGTLLSKEERAVGVLDARAYAAFFRQATQSHSLVLGVALFCLIVLLVVLAEACRTSTELWVMLWVESTEGSHASLADKDRGFWIAGYALLLVALTVVSAVQIGIFTRAVVAVGGQTHSSMLSKLLSASVPLFFDVVPTGRILNRFSKDLDSLDLQLPEFMSEFFQGAAYVLATAAICIAVSPWTLVAVVPMVVIFVRIRKFYGASSRELKRMEAIARSPLYVHFQETLSGRVHIRAFGLRQQMLSEFEAKVDDNVKIFVHQYALIPWLMFRVNSLASTLIVAVVAIVSFLGGSPTLVGLSLASGAGLIGKLHMTVQFSIETENHFTAVERLEQFMHVPQERTGATGGGQVTPAAWPARGEISFEDVRLRYRPRLPLVLDGVSFRVGAGQRAGLIGRTGSGKSSCMLALLRVVELQSGRISIDGVDISGVPLQLLRGEAVAIIPQDPYLFAGSVRDNLDPEGSANPQEISEALNRAQLAALVEAGGGLSSEVQARGANFSVGQRQLLCIARALLRRPRVVLLDEASASIDAGTDMLIQQAIRVGFSGSTLLIVAHRLSTIADADIIVCLEKGRVVEAGPPAELRVAGGPVAKMFRGAGDVAAIPAESSVAARSHIPADGSACSEVGDKSNTVGVSSVAGNGSSVGGLFGLHSVVPTSVSSACARGVCSAAARWR